MREVIALVAAPECFEERAMEDLGKERLTVTSRRRRWHAMDREALTDERYGWTSLNTQLRMNASDSIQSDCTDVDFATYSFTNRDDGSTYRHMLVCVMNRGIVCTANRDGSIHGKW